VLRHLAVDSVKTNNDVVILFVKKEYFHRNCSVEKHDRSGTFVSHRAQMLQKTIGSVGIT
jgi:hypothetical protein